MKGIEGDIQLKIMQMKRLDSIDSVDKFFLGELEGTNLIYMIQWTALAKLSIKTLMLLSTK